VQDILKGEEVTSRDTVAGEEGLWASRKIGPALGAKRYETPGNHDKNREFGPYLTIIRYL